MGKLNKKIAVVTGAARGIGREIALRLASEGATIIVVDVASDGEETVQTILSAGGEARAEIVDVSQNDQVLEMISSTVELYGGVDILVNNAAVEINGPLEDTTEEDWDRVFAVNVKGIFLTCKHALPIMKNQERGCIINIGSAVAVKGFPQFAAYSGSKGAVLQITRSLALEVRDQGIRVNCVCPGMTDTAMGRHALAGYGEGAETVIRQTQMRWGTPNDVAGVVVFLALDESGFIIGQPIHVDGGLTT